MFWCTDHNVEANVHFFVAACDELPQCFVPGCKGSQFVDLIVIACSRLVTHHISDAVHLFSSVGLCT